ncbi:thiamine S protein [Desulfovibrio sp. X2]|uniref:MoaD/ThiS family protein n=1 Tax=Desulfovibrio sp. X2 TaxID=941449 RepID=UPI000358B450|nr:MoaD/ThiS family protein [Desulfovibrio sp. X2]EPR43582.1 thiamine S protein [Desulfovibrio sp. X2]
MHITVKCFATLGPFQPAESDRYPLQPGESAEDVMRRLGIAPDSVAVLFVNGRHAEPGVTLADGDRVSLFPAVGGG